MTVLSVLDAAGRRRSPATLPGYHAGRPPHNKEMRYPADPPAVEEIVAVMRHAADDRHGWRVRAMIIVLWRAGLRVQEALALAEHDLEPRRGSLLVRNGKGGSRREVGMDEWGWDQLRPWLAARVELPVGPLCCIIDGPTRGRPWSGAAVRSEFRRLAVRPGSGVGSPHNQLRHAHVLELAGGAGATSRPLARTSTREGWRAVDLLLRQLGHGAPSLSPRPRKAPVTGDGSPRRAYGTPRSPAAPKLRRLQRRCLQGFRWRGWRRRPMRQRLVCRDCTLVQ